VVANLYRQHKVLLSDAASSICIWTNEWNKYIPPSSGLEVDAEVMRLYDPCFQYII
jgi:hypothetical protein